MIGALLLACLAGDVATVGIETDRKEYYVGEPIPVRVRVTLDAKFLAENAVPLTLRKMDVPVLVEASWLKGLPSGSGDATLAVNDDVVAARRAPGTGTVLLIERTLRPETAGDLVLDGPVLRFARATRFEEDALGSRVALDRVESSVKGEPLTLHVLPLPGATRPVGRFTMAATVDATEVDAGKSLHLILSVNGEGELGAVRAPRLDDLAGFHVLGRLDAGDATRTFAYEIEPLDASVTEIPSIPLEYFDPTPPGAYRTARTAAIPIRVRGAAKAPPRKLADECLEWVVGLFYLAVAAVTVPVLIYLKRRKARSSPPPPPPL